MSVVLQMGLVLMVIMAGIELYVNTMFRPEKFQPETYHPFIRPVMRMAHQLGPWIEANAVYSLIFSFALSVLLGFVYPIAGIAAFIGGIGSTLLVQPYYFGRRVIARARAERPRARAVPARSAEAHQAALRAKLGR